MDMARISSKGQMTLPISVRKALNLKSGDKVIILEENGRYYIENASMLAFNGVEEAFSGDVEKAGFKTEEELQKYAYEIRKEVRGY